MILTLYNMKGGTGKTTAAVHLAAAAAREGRRVLLLDNDPQGSATTYLGAERTDAMYRAYQQDLAKTDIQATASGVDVVAANMDLALLAGEATVRPGQLFSRTAGVLEAYDDLVIDCTPSLGKLVAASFRYVELAHEFYSDQAGGLVIPVLTAGAEMQGLVDMLGAHPHISRADVVAIVPLAYHAGRSIDKAALAALRQTFPELVTTPVRISVRFAEAAAAGRTVFEVDPGGRGEQDFTAVYEELHDRLEALRDLRELDRDDKRPTPTKQPGFTDA